MILNRFATALKSQDWITVFIEFVLVVLGVIVALEVDRYSERQRERAKEVAYLSALERDLNLDISDIESLIDGYSQIEAFAVGAIATLENQGCPDNQCWYRLVELLHASQWLDVSLNSSTYEEMKRLGLPTDGRLKDELEQYHALGDRRARLTRELPEYRKLVRSLIPPAIQTHYWSNCYSVTAKRETYISDCPASVTAEAARSVIQRLQQMPEVRMALTYWLSNLRLTVQTLPQQVDYAEELIADIHTEVRS
jgi:hypothetical protein